MGSDDFVIDLTEDEVKALEAPYAPVDPTPETVAKKDDVRETRQEKEDPPPKKQAHQDQTKPAPKDDPDVWAKRLREAEERTAKERDRRVAAEKRAHDTSQSLAVTEAKAVEADYYAVHNAKSRVESEIASLKHAHKAALESGDYDAATEAADKMAEARARYTDLASGETELKSRLETARERAKTAAESKLPDDSDGDEFEGFLKQFGPREQSWFREHPECTPMRNPKMFARAQAAHYAAVADDIKEGTDEYFAHLDKSLGFARGESADDGNDRGEDDVVVDTAKSESPRQPKRVAAPVSRDGSIVTRREDGKYQVRLTTEQREIAEAMGMTASAYAKQLIIAERDGRLSTQQR